jgi:streptogramin lyase
VRWLIRASLSHVSRTCVSDFETDQSIGFTAAFPLARGSWARVVGVLLVLALALAGCGGGADGSGARLQPSAERPIEVGGAPVAIAVGAGAVWAADNTGSRVVRLDPRNGRLAGRPIPVGAGPDAIAVGEGAVWVASGNDTVTRIDPGTASTRRAPIDIADPTGIAAGEGSVWVTSHADRTVIRLDPKTLRAVGDPTPVGREPGDIAVGAGAAWVSNTADGTVTRIDASSGQPGDPIQVAEYQVLGLSFGEDGVWVAKTDDRLARTIDVVRIDPGSSTVGEAAAEVRAAIPVQLAAGEGGVWVTLVGGVRAPDLTPRPGGVALVDPAAVAEAGKPLRVGERPSAVAVGGGAVWVADSGDGTVTRIRPRTE